MGREERFCPRCGRTMSLVAAGWYCVKDDYLIDPVTGKPIEPSFAPSIRREPEIAKARPSEITILVVLEVIAGGAELLPGLALLFTSVYLTRFLPMGIPFMPVGLVTLIAGVMVIVGLIDLLTARGLWSGRSWAWRVALILAIFRVAMGLLSLIAGLVTLVTLPIESIVSPIVQGLVIYLLTRPHVKAFLGREAPPSPTPQAAGPI